MNEPNVPATSGKSAPYITDRWLTVPNIICITRLAGAPVLVGFALAGLSEIFLWVFLVLAMSDWVDGKLAILLNQRSVIGARLDTWADTALYSALFLGSIILFGETLWAELGWFVPALVAYLASTAACLWKFGRWPSYHTRAAKTGWFLVLIAAIGLFTGWSLWPLRIMLAFSALTNLETLAITLLSSKWQVDVNSVYHVWRDK